MMKHRTTFKKVKEHYLLEEEYDEDLDSLRWARYRASCEEEDNRQARERMERWARFFTWGMCHEHDREGCNECSHYARGGCPSYWEEKY